MAIDPEETRARLERLLRDAAARVPERPVEAEAPVLRARRAIRVRYAVLLVASVGLVVVLTGGAVLARDRLDRDGPEPSGPSATASTGPTTVEPPPVARITSAPPDPSNETAPVFEFRLVGPGTAECFLDGAPLTTCESGMEVPVVDGEHTFEVRGVSPGGVPGRIDAHPWTVDTVAPILTLDAVSVVYTRGEGATCSVDDEPFECDGPALPADAGSEYFIATNGLGLSWTFDPMPPDLRFTGEGDPGSPTTSRLVLRFGVDDDHATVTCTINDASAMCDERTVLGTLENSSTEQVASVIQIVATDAADNPSEPLSFRWTFAVQSIPG